MGYFFQNVGQMAGFFLNEAGIDKLQKENNSTAGLLPFDSILQSLSNAGNESYHGLPINNDNTSAVDFVESKEAGIELIEKIDLDSDVLKLCISKSNNTVTLEIPSEKISQFTDGLLAPQVNRKAGWSFNGNLAEIKQSLNRPLENDLATYKISFKPADLLATEVATNNRMAAVTISNPISAGIPHHVEISRLIQLVSKYPEPIYLEVEILPEIEREKDIVMPVLTRNTGVRSLFKFDLRNLFENGQVKDSELIEGIKTTTEKNISNIESVNTGFKNIKSVQAAKFNYQPLNIDRGQSIKRHSEFNNSIFNIERSQSITGHSNFNKIIQNNGNAPESRLDFGTVFQMNENTANSLLNNKTNNSLKDYNNARLNNNDNVIAKTLGEKRKAAAGESKTNNSLKDYNNTRSNNNDNVIVKTLDEKQKAGAGESKTNAKDNSSALSKIFVGSEPVSENMQVNKDGVKILNEFSAASPNKIMTAESKLPETVLTTPRAIENIEKIKSNIINASRMGRSTIRMKLHPKNLGILRVKLVWNTGKLSVDFNVETRKAGEVVSALLPELKASLEEGNLKINNINLLVDENKESMAFGQGRQFHSGSTDNYNDKQFQFSEKESPPDEDLELIEKDRPQSVHNGWVDLKA